ncbi:MAG TPA: alanine--glyoxylate aminotransferase family protein [Nitrososphaerales archaeon]|nr:alanine--glyoxylate aminotransferase family protein [Nitrososphaerales archaeon]
MNDQEMMLDEDELLLIPGPTTLSSHVRAVMSQPQKSHVAPEFYNAFKELLDLSRYLFGNSNGLQFVFTGSGSIGMESSVISLFEPGDRVLCLETGYFGHRFSMMAEIHGCKLETMVSEFGRHIDYGVVERKLRSEKFKAVLFTHVDTSTSVMNDVSELARIAGDNDVLSVCDSVCGVGGAPLAFDDLGLDIALTGSQKAIAAPPGATLLAVSKRAFEVMEKRKTPIASYYMNLVRWKPIMDDPKIYLTTPAVQVMLALREALVQIKEEGLKKRWERHEKLARALQSGLESLDLRPGPDVESRSPTVTAFHVPSGKSAEFQESLRHKYGIHIARGFGEYANSMMRIGHFGNISAMDVLSFLGAMELTLKGSTSVQSGRAVDKALSML